MRIIFAIKRLESAAGGAERVFSTICSELVGRGHEVIAVTFDQPDMQPFYALDARVKRIDLGLGHSERPAGWLETVQRIFALRRAITAAKPDIAVGFMHSMFVPLAFALAGTGIPLVASEHIVPAHYRSRPLQFMALLLAVPFLDCVTVLSRSIQERYPAFIRHKMTAMPNPVMPVPDPVESPVVSAHDLILNVGRLDPQKDQATLVRAFASIAPDFPQWRLRIVGDGALKAHLLKLIDNLGMNGRIQMAGVIRDIHEEYRAAKVFVIPSRYESFGLVTAEAMAHGLPAIGFADCPGTNELIQNRVTGILVPPGQDRVAALARAIAELLSAPALRKSLGDAGKRAIDHAYASHYIGGLWEALLDRHSKARNLV